MRLAGARRTVLSLALAAAALARPAHACDSSSCAMLTRGQAGLIGKGQWSVDFYFRYTDQGQPLLGKADVPQAIRPKVDYENQRLQPYYHVELDGSDTILQADAAYGVTDRLALTLSLPLLGVRSYNHIHYPPPPDPTAPFDTEHGHGGADPSGPVVLRLRTEGNGDALFGTRYTLLGSPRQRLHAGLGIQIPIGRSRIVDPHDGSLFDPMLQPGSGSWDLLGALTYGTLRGGFDWTASASYQVTTANGLEYRFGNEAIGGLGVSRGFGRVTTSLQFKAHHLDRSLYRGQTVPSSGGTMLILTPGVRMRFATASVYAFYQRPFYKNVNEYQLASRGGLMLGVSRSF
jgi:hypothetical protein